MTRLLFLLTATALVACNDNPTPVETNNAVADPAASPSVPAPAAPDASGSTATPPFAETPGAHPTAPEPAPIPARFRGTWADSKAACADLKHHSRLTISGRTLRFPTFVMLGDSVTASGNQFALKGKIEGTNRLAEAQYFISADGNTLTDGGGGGAVRVRCG